MTIINNSGLNSKAGILAQQFAKRAAQQPVNLQPAAPAPASPTATQPDQADPYAALREFVNKWKDAQQAISSMSNAGQSISHARKAAAAEMLNRLKEQLKIMMSMLASMDPKTRARLIAQMSRDLAAAAREYAAASGGGAQESVTVNVADSGGTQNDSAAASGGEQPANADATAVAADTAPSPDAGAESAAAATAATPTTAANPADATSTSQQVGDTVRGKLAEYAQNSGSPDAKADQEFAMEVRKLAAMLKALAKQGEVHAPKHPEKSTEREMANISEALKEVEHSLSSIESGSAAVTISISVVAK